MGFYPHNPVSSISHSYHCHFFYHLRTNTRVKQERAAAGEEAFDMHLCDASPEETARLKVVAAKTPIPEMDPLYGVEGPLPRIWGDADRVSIVERSRL